MLVLLLLFAMNANATQVTPGAEGMANAVQTAIEAQRLAELHHENVLRFYGACVSVSLCCSSFAQPTAANTRGVRKIYIVLVLEKPYVYERYWKKLN